VRVLEIGIIFSIIVLIGMVGFQNSFALPTIEEKCEGGREISLDYTIQGKEVVKICDGVASGSLFFGLEGTSNGTMQISLPFLGNHSNTAHLACAFEYFVLDNDEETLSSFEETDYGKRITLDFKNNTKVIQIFAPSYLNESAWQKIWSCEKKFSKELPPKKQTFAGISNENIYCREDYVLTFKATNNSPACVKPESIPKLIDRGWAKLVTIQPDIGKTGKYSLEIDNGKVFDIKYSVKGANILSMNSLKEKNSVKINLDSPYAGSLIISMPRQLIDAKISENVDDLFFVFVDGNEVPYTEIKENTIRTLTIGFGQGARIIEILGVSPL